MHLLQSCCLKPASKLRFSRLSQVQLLVVNSATLSAGLQLPHKMHLDGKQIAGSQDYHRYYGYFNEDRAFLDCVKDQRMPECDLRQAVASMQALEYLDQHKL